MRRLLAADLLSRYKMLKIEIYDGAKKKREKFSLRGSEIRHEGGHAANAPVRLRSRG